MAFRRGAKVKPMVSSVTVSGWMLAISDDLQAEAFGLAQGLKPLLGQGAGFAFEQCHVGDEAKGDKVEQSFRTSDYGYRMIVDP